MRSVHELDRKRRELGLTYAELSAKSGVSVPTLQKIFSETTKSPRFSTLRKLEQALFTENDTQPVHADILREPPALYGAAPALISEETPRRMPKIYDPNDWVSRLGKPQGTFTVEDVEKIPEDQRYELIDGVLIRLEAPSFEHQRILAYLTTQLYRYTEEEDCDCVVVCAPFDVQLDRDQKTLVEPDVLVICSEENVNKKRGVGAPDLCIEILSPSTRSKDQLLKRYKYERAGVKEFWIVDPEYRRVLVYIFDLDSEPKVYSFEDSVPIGICGGKHAIDFSKCRIGFRRRQPESTT